MVLSAQLIKKHSVGLVHETREDDCLSCINPKGFTSLPTTVTSCSEEFISTGKSSVMMEMFLDMLKVEALGGTKIIFFQGMELRAPSVFIIFYEATFIIEYTTDLSICSYCIASY